jgi:hypothetical protein
MKLVGHAARIGQLRNVYITLSRMPEEKRPLRKSRCRREDNINIYLQEILCEVVDWIHVALDRVQRR